MSNKTLRNMVLALGVLLLIYIITNSFALGGNKVVKLQKGPALSGIVSQALGASPSGAFLVPNKDFKMSTKYFENNEWAVVTIVPISDTVNGGVSVLTKQNGTYKVVIEPSNALTNNQIQSLPVDVGSYVSARVGVYTPSP